MLEILLLVIVLAALVRALMLLRPVLWPPPPPPPPPLPDVDGWTPERPIGVRSVAVIEPRAARQRCLRCAARVDVENNQVVQHRGEALREAPIACRKCDWTGALYFRLETRP